MQEYTDETNVRPVVVQMDLSDTTKKIDCRLNELL